MFSWPNFLTLMRFPLALVFLQDDPFWRCAALILAMLSDGLDGYCARRYGKISRFGTFMGPISGQIFCHHRVGCFAKGK